MVTANRSTQYLIGCITILLILFIFSFELNPLLLRIFNASKVDATIFFTSRLFYWICLVLIWIYAIKVEKQKLLIWQEKKYSFLTYFASVIIILLICFVGAIIIQRLLILLGLYKKSLALSELFYVFQNNKALLVFTALTAGIVEELIFRGYLQPRLQILVKSPFLTITISSLLFGLLHYRYGTLANVLGPIFIGLIFSWYYWKYRNIMVLIICHFLWDLIALLISTNSH